VTDLEGLVAADGCRFANRLSGWAEVEDGRITSYGHSGGGLIGSTTMRLGRQAMTFAAVALPDRTSAERLDDATVRLGPAPLELKGSRRMASISKRTDGRWRACYRDDAGRELARHFGRKVDAQRWLDETIASIVTGAYVAPNAGRCTCVARHFSAYSRKVTRPAFGAT